MLSPESGQNPEAESLPSDNRRGLRLVCLMSSRFCFELFGLARGFRSRSEQPFQPYVGLLSSISHPSPQKIKR